MLGGSPGARDLADPGLIIDTPSAPTILGQAGELTAWSGKGVTLTAVASGQAPMTWRWRKNGAEIIGATSSSLVLTNLARGDAGIYSATVSNNFGSMSSTIAVVHVNVPRRILSIARQPDGANALIAEQIEGGPFTVDDLGRIEVWVSSNLSNWSVLPVPLGLDNGLIVLRDPPAATSPTRFYRLAEN